MTDIIQVADEYYVRASSALADDRTRVLKYGDTFAVFNRYGDIEAFGPSQFGLFHAESRHLSRFTLRLNQQGPLLLSSTVNEDNSFLSVDLTNVDSALNSMASQERAEAVSALLMSGQLFSGWGIRTVGAAESRYNPMSYHNGSVWPHDNALIGMGFSLYGLQDHACKILYGLHEASRQVELQRLPELFCGFHKRHGAIGPTLYPVACAPQAWSAGSVFLLLQACLGLKVRTREPQICFVNPCLPSNLDEVRIENLRVGDAFADLLISRGQSSVDVKVLCKNGDIEILKSA